MGTNSRISLVTYTVDFEAPQDFSAEQIIDHVSTEGNWHEISIHPNDHGNPFTPQYPFMNIARTYWLFLASLSIGIIRRRSRCNQFKIVEAECVGVSRRAGDREMATGTVSVAANESRSRRAVFVDPDGLRRGEMDTSCRIRTRDSSRRRQGSDFAVEQNAVRSTLSAGVRIKITNVRHSRQASTLFGVEREGTARRPNSR